MAINTNLFSYYKFDGGLTDTMGAYNGTGANPGNITYPSSMTGFGQCMDLAPNSYSNIGSVSQWGSGSFSISCWINSDAAPSGANYSVFAADNSGSIGFALFTHSGYSGRLRLEIGTNGADWRNIWSTNPLVASQWYHVVIVVDRATNSAQMYIDGTLQSYVQDTGTAAGSLSVVGTIPTKANYWGASDNSGLTYWDGKIDDGVLWNRALTSAEVTQIYNAGTAGNPFLTLLPGPAALKGMFGSIIHNAPPDVGVLEGMFGSIVHNAPPNESKLEGMWGSLVHNATPDVSVLEGMWGSVVHNVPAPAAICPDITGNPGVPATFDGSASTTVTYYRWSWVSVPGGSTIANAAIPFPDSGAATPIDMTGNLGLWHFDAINSVASPTGSIGLIDTYGDGWHNQNFVTVSVGGVAVLTNITLPSGAGPLWFDYVAGSGAAVSVVFNGGSYKDECQYSLNDGPGGTGTTFYTSTVAPSGPSTPYNFTAGTFSPATSYNTSDTSGGNRTLQLYGATLAAGKVGSHCLDFDGTNDYLIYEAADVLPGTTNAISISFWQYGDTGYSNTIFWAEDGSGNRVVNIHLPYLGTIYFDCGSGYGSGSRISKSASSSEYQGQWNHFVFIKDVSAGIMQIWLNGALWHSGTGKTVALPTVTKLVIGAQAGTSGFYNGKIDELAIWSRVLSADEIADIYLAQNGTLAGIGTSTFTFTPDIVSTALNPYRINLAIDGSNNTNADAIISLPSSGGGGTPGQGGSLQGNILQGFNTEGLI